MNSFDQAVFKSLKSILIRHRAMIAGIALLIIACGVKVEVIRARAERLITEQRKEILYIKDGYDTSLIISVKDSRRKVSALCTDIITTYGYKYHPKKPMAMNKAEREEFIRRNIEFAELLGYGYYDLIAIALMESGFNPYSEGELQDEGGLFQLSPAGVADACLYFRQLPPELKKKFTFKYDNHFEDLQDPINCLKVAAVLYWGLRKDYKRQADWVLTFYHWGKTYIHKYYKINEFPEVFIFNEGTERESRRSVIGYFNTWHSITQKFIKGNIEIQKELDYWIDIRRRMTLPELKLIDSYKTIKKLNRLLKEVEKTERDHNKGMKEYYKRIRGEVQATDKKYKKIFKGVKTGQFEKFRRIGKYMLQSRDFYRDFRDRVYKNDQWQFWTIFAAVVLLFLVGILILVILIFIFKYLVRGKL